MLRQFSVWIFLLLLWMRADAQVLENFSDGDFTANPVWFGEVDSFRVNNFELQSKGDSLTSDTVYLVTNNGRVDTTEWDFYLRLEFNPSSTNFVRVYLVSDNPVLEGIISGYYLQLGESGTGPDSLDFFRQDGSTHVQLFSGALPCTPGTTSNAVRVKVIRDLAGNWTVLADCSGGYNYVQHGAVFDNTYSLTNTFGFYCKYSTTSRFNKFFFDDIYIGHVIGDTVKPNVIAANFLSPTSVEVIYSEPVTLSSSQNPLNYSLSPGSGPLVSAVRNPTDSSRVTLTYTNAFVSNTTYALSVQNVSDTAGNLISPPQSVNFYYYVLGSPAFKDVVISEIYADPDTFVSNLPGAEFVELHNRSNKVLDLIGWKISDPGFGGLLPSFILPPGGYVILCKAADTAMFRVWGSVLGVSLPTLNNTGDFLGLRDNNFQLMDTVPYLDDWYRDPIKMTGGWTLELIDPDDTCRLDSNWIASIDPDGGTPGQVNSVNGTGTPDVTPPYISSARILQPDTIQICFSEKMDGQMIRDASKYSLSPASGTIVNVIPDLLNTCVKLVFTQPLSNTQIYTLSVTNARDCPGNVATTLTTQAAIGVSPAPHQVVFNEVLADENPRIGLPMYEFVELLNTGTTAVRLEGCTFSDPSTTGIIPTYVMLPGEHLILCSTTAADSFRTYGSVLGISPWPSLNSTGDSLRLKDAGGTLLDEVDYDPAWFNDAVKDDGGWSLERRDSSFTCANPGNWGASTDPSGGTPGRANSIAGVFADTQGPSVVQAIVLTPSKIRVTFSEGMSPVQLADVNAYSIDNGIGTPLTAVAADAQFTSADLTLGTAVDSNRIYTVTVTNISDCPGNAITTPNAAQFGIPLPAQPGDILINEILFNPYTGGSDFVELYNHSDKIIDLSSLYLGEVYHGTDSVFNENVIVTTPYLIFPAEHLAFTLDRDFQLATYLPPFPGNIIEVNDLPSFDDTEGECALRNAGGTMLDRFHYLDDYHYPDLDDKEGVSLERLSWNRPTQDPGNWHSAASTVHYATPGYLNSQEVTDGAGSGEVWCDPQTFSPDNDGREDVLSIHMKFADPGRNIRITIFDNQGRAIRALTQNLLAGTGEMVVTWDGTDDDMHRADVGIYVILVETSNANSGKMKNYRIGCVVAARF